MEKKNKIFNLKKSEKKKIDDLTVEIDKKNIKKKKNKKIGHKALVILLSCGIAFVSFILIFAVYIIVTAPDFDTDLLYSKEATVLTYKQGDEEVEFARLGRQNRDLISYDEIPQVLIDAIVATEDARYFQHDGFDIGRFIMASIGQVGGVSGAGGASTLTMQVVKNTYTSKNASGLKGIIRKFTDIYMAIFKVEKKYTKEEILEFYVNEPWLGSGVYGVEQASQKYFGKSVKDLSLPEAALIAGIFNAPASQNPFNSVENATARRNRVLDLMCNHGYITEEQRDDAKNISVESLIVEKNSASLNKYQTYVDAVVSEVEEKTGLNAYQVPMKIETTMDPKMQDVMVELSEGKLYKFPDDAIQVGLVIEDVNTGAILALNGARNQTGERELNRAIEIKRQPGSTIKPILDYGPLIEYNNASTGTYFWDNRMTYSNGQNVNNSDGSYYGMINMRTALARSRNIPAIQAFQQVDKEKIGEFAHGLGVDYGDELYEAYAIGGGMSTVNPKMMAGAYAAFANGGYHIEPYTYTKIILKDTNEVIEQKPKKEKVMSDETAWMITSILQTCYGYGIGGNFRISGTDIAAKSGTSSFDSALVASYGLPADTSADNWLMTYSPDYVISLWYGYDKLEPDAKKTKQFTRMVPAAKQKQAIMAAVAKKVYKKNSKFNMPSSIVKVEIEKESVPLQLPSAHTPADMRLTEYFRNGTEPSEESNRYQTLENPTNGKGSLSGNVINISFDGIATPAAIDPTKLQEDFNENYGQFAKQYYEKRIAYNNANMGELGYQIYLEQNGTLTPLAYIKNTTYSYDTHGYGGTYKFVIKSAYSIFKDNMSDGLIIEVNTGVSPTGESTYTIGSISLRGSNNETIDVVSTGAGAYYNDDGVKVLDPSGKDITSYVKVTKTITNLNTGEKVRNIDLSKPGKYEIVYSVEGYQDSPKRIVTVQ